jgi:CRP-like cAMP-binding protein
MLFFNLFLLLNKQHKLTLQEKIETKELLLKHMSAAFPLQEKEIDELFLLFTERKIKRRGFILHQGDVCKHFTFVVSGCFKMYAIDQAGKEHNLEFAAENEWLSDLSGFYSEKPGSVYIEAIEPSVILQITRPDLIYLYSNYPKFNSTFRIIIERKYIQLQNRVLQNISATAEERYVNFTTQYPALATRLPNTQIASYLGITAEFLSKIRKDLAHKR